MTSKRASYHHILVVYKKSLYEIYQSQKLSGLGDYRGLKASHKRHYEVLRKIEVFLREKKIRFSTVYRAGRFNVSQFDLVIAVGGDGTFLEAARKLKGQPLLGVNSDPSHSVGIFCGADSHTFVGKIETILRGAEEPKKLNRLQTLLNGRPWGSDILNDVLLCHENPAMMTRYKITVRGSSEEHKDSGLWVSTAAGSTGAARSAGGKVFPLLSKKIQYVPRELYAGRGEHYRFRGDILSRPEDLVLVSLMREGAIYADGPHVKKKLSYGDKISFEHSPYPLRVYGK